MTDRSPDVLALQEVRADDATLTKLLEDSLGGGWHVAHVEPTDAGTKGRAGVAVATRRTPRGQRQISDSRFAGAGRWIEIDIESEMGPLTIISVYVHTGEAGSPRQDEKYAFLEAMSERLSILRQSGIHAILCGDFNIAHHQRDIKNWKGNLKKAGFLEEERAYLGRWIDEEGWVDVVRNATGNLEGPYSWWSWRGRAFDSDAGWRIDYQLATPAVAETVQNIWIDKASTYAQRWSDHAPVVVQYNL